MTRACFEPVPGCDKQLWTSSKGPRNFGDIPPQACSSSSGPRPTCVLPGHTGTADHCLTALQRAGSAAPLAGPTASQLLDKSTGVGQGSVPTGGAPANSAKAEVSHPSFPMSPLCESWKQG